ncbi:hypothetical protein BDR05DRAFT_562246 [Suillus weaverae]|nr:hypothetical protein BDR05DRAFT_562246 [Suillus weaverae]
MDHQEQVISDTSVDQTQKVLDNVILSSNLASARKLNKLNPAEVVVTQTFQEIRSDYNQNTAETQAIVDLTKKSTSDFLGEAKMVVDALDSLQHIHPLVDVAIILFKAVVNLELTRRENDRKVVLMISQASNMMNMLHLLKGTRENPIMGPHGEIPGPLQPVLNDIRQDIVDCGNAIDKFYKSRLMVKLFRSSHWAGEFVNICNNFSKRTQDLQLALSLSTLLKVDITNDKLEKLTILIQRPSERELRFEKEVQKRGGRDQCLENNDKLAELMKITESWEARPQKPGSKIASTNGSGDEQYRLDATLLHDLHAPLRSLLDENHQVFMFKLDKQTADIKDAIKDSETRIIWAFSSRFRLVKDLHLQYIWKEMKWPTNVKTLYFIAELHDYYTNCFSRLRHDAVLLHSTSGASSLVVQISPSSPTSSVVSDLEGEDRELPAIDPAYHELPTIDPADKWCLKYLTVFYVPSLSESFDNDANGLVSIREVNAFTSVIPQGWSLLQALAYWAAGWRVDSQHYHTRIEQVLASMIDVQADALPENRRCIATYLNDVVDAITRLVRSLAELRSEHSDLNLMQLTDQRRKAQEKMLAHKLSKVKYEIDSRDSLKLFESGRIENFLLPLLYLVISRHLQIMKLASTVILVERELVSATQTIWNILGGVNLRMEQLAESFRQQGIDPKMRFKWYAHGLYNFWYSSERITRDTEYWESHNFGFDDTELEIDATALKLGPFCPTEDRELLERPVMFTAFSAGQQPEDPKEEYIRLWCMNALHADKWRKFYAHDVPSYLSLKDKERFNTLCQELLPADVKRWNSLAELHLRSRLFDCQCNACDYLITDVTHRCLDRECDDYDLCAECESLPVSKHKYPSNHKSTHNMLVFRASLPYIAYERANYHARNTLLLHAAPLKGLSREDKPPTQSNGPKPPHSTEVTQEDVSSTSVNLGEDDEKSSGDAKVALSGTAATSFTNEDAYTCAECGVKLNVYYVCLHCREHTSISLCGDCAFRDVFNVVTQHHPYKHWLVKIKDKVQDADGTSDEPVNNSDKTSALVSLSSDSRVDNLAAMVESRFTELDLRISGLVTQVDQIMLNLAELTGKAQPLSGSVNGS